MSSMGFEVTQSDNEKFDQNYVIVSESGCWIWTAGQVGNRYGKIWVKPHGKAGQHVLAHRYSYARFRGNIANNGSVCHRCDIPLCVNPDHLWIGSHHDNMADMVAKGRHVPPKLGEENHSAKLTEGEVLAIFVAQGSHEEIAKPYRISASTVGRIKSGKIWGHLTKNLRECADA